MVIITSFPHAVPKALDSALKSIKRNKFQKVVLGSELLQDGEPELRREEGALVRVCPGAGEGAGLQPGGACPEPNRMNECMPVHARLPACCPAAPGGLLPCAGVQQVFGQLSVDLHRHALDGAPVAEKVRIHVPQIARVTEEAELRGSRMRVRHPVIPAPPRLQTLVAL